MKGIKTIVTLDPDTEAELRRQAAIDGLSKSSMIRCLVRRGLWGRRGAVMGAPNPLDQVREVIEEMPIEASEEGDLDDPDAIFARAADQAEGNGAFERQPDRGPQQLQDGEVRRMAGARQQGGVPDLPPAGQFAVQR